MLASGSGGGAGAAYDAEPRAERPVEVVLRQSCDGLLGDRTHSLVSVEGGAKRLVGAIEAGLVGARPGRPATVAASASGSPR